MLYVNKRRASAILLALLVAFGGVEAHASSTDVFKNGVVEEEAILWEEPWNGKVPAAEEQLDYETSLAMRIEGSARENPVSENPPSRFPELESEKEILAYLKRKYPATRNQTTGRVHYGSCWAHAAAALAEFYAIRHGLSDRYGPVNTRTNYSELQLAYFCYHETPEPLSGDTGDALTLYLDSGKRRNFLNLGGNLRFAAQSLMRRNGFVRDAGAVAYKKAKRVLKYGLDGKYAAGVDALCLKNAMMVNLWQNPKLVKQAILANGAVGITFHYQKRYMNRRTNAYFNGRKASFNHVAVVVGWDDSYPAENFREKPEADGAWLIRNSHSVKTAFSPESYFWLSYYDTSLGTAAYIYEMADRGKGETFDNQYYYDGQLHNVTNAMTRKSANVFKAFRQEEVLKAVQFDVTCGIPGNYRVTVYKNPSDPNDPESGEPAADAVTCGKLSFAGYYTIPLKAPVALKKGDTFCVVVETDTPVDRECDAFWKKQLSMDTSMHELESFSFVDGEWWDLSWNTADNTRGNLCIRALTDTVKWVASPDTRTRLNIHSSLAGAMNVPGRNALNEILRPSASE